LSGFYVEQTTDFGSNWGNAEVILLQPYRCGGTLVRYYSTLVLLLVLLVPVVLVLVL
jgi:hypothetical protein